MDKDEARATLRKMLRVGDTVYTELLHVGRNGMNRTIGVYIGRGREVRNISYLTSVVTERRMDRDRGGVKMGGAGMDMGFALVYDLASALWPKGHYCTTRKGRYGQHVCPSNDHVNERGETRYGRRVHRDGGYALHQSWL